MRFSVVEATQGRKQLLVQHPIGRAQELGDGEAEGVGEFLDVVDGNVTCKDALQGRSNVARGCRTGVRRIMAVIQ